MIQKQDKPSDIKTWMDRRMYQYTYLGVNRRYPANYYLTHTINEMCEEANKNWKTSSLLNEK